MAGEVELFGRLGEWGGEAAGAGGVGDQGHVLDEDVERALDLVGGVHHAGAAVVEHERRGRAAAQDLPGGGGVEVEGFGEGECFGGGGDVHPAQQLVDEFDLLPVAGRGPDMGGGAGHRVEQRPHPLHGRRRAADHDEQVPGAGADGPTGDRGVDQVDLLLPEPLRPLPHRGGTDRRHDDDHRAGREGVGGGVVAEEHALDLVGGGDHDTQHVATGGRVGDRGRRGHSVSGQRLGAGGVDVVGGDGEPRPGQTARHRGTHRAQAHPPHSCPRDVVGHCAVLPLNRSIT